jgi:MFS family permease
VQSAATLPVFLLGIPSGALADIIDRRRYFITTQFWVASVAIVLCVTALTNVLTAPLLLLLIFANGIGLAMRLPTFAALIPGLVTREELPSALAMNGIAMNASRIIGPLIAGALISAAGTAYVFVLNAILSIGAGIVLLRWRREEQKVSTLPAERFFGAIRTGLQYVRQSPVMHSILLRMAGFFLGSQAVMALLPLVAKSLPGGDARTFTVLLASMGAGAIGAAFFLPRLRQFMTRDELVRNGTLVHATATLTVALAPNVYVAIPAMVAAGMAWISVANSLTVSAQMALPDWVRARGMSVVQTAIMGGAGLGAALWGQVATLGDVHMSLMIASGAACVGLVLLRKFKVGGRAEEDLTPVGLWKEPEVAIPLEPDEGPVLITVEYRIDPARAGDFADVMRESRRSRLRNGAIAWGLFKDTADPGRYVEYFVDESWTEYLRRHERTTAGDLALRERRESFHVGKSPPVVGRFIAEPVNRA